VGVPFRIGVVVEFVCEVASRFPGAVSEIPLFCWVVRKRPGGMFPVTVHEPIFEVFVTVKPKGTMATPTVALNGGRGPVGLPFRVVASVVAPAIESTAPSAAAAIPVDLRSEPTGEAATYSPAEAATRRTGVRCNRATSVAVDTFIHPQRRRRFAYNEDGFMKKWPSGWQAKGSASPPAVLQGTAGDGRDSRDDICLRAPHRPQRWRRRHRRSPRQRPHCSCREAG
jgi:hypothetical protein